MFMASSSAVGAYGFRVNGLSGGEALLVPVPPHWPIVDVAVRSGRDNHRGALIDDDHADLELIDGIVAHVQRSPAGVTFVTPQPLTVQALAHPFLGGVASLFGYWQGRESFHGGAFLAGGKAWGVVADREGGKSTTMAWMAQNGIAVLSDDLIMLDGSLVLAGPRSIDLREEPISDLAAEELGIVGARARWRVSLGAVPAEVPLGGWFFLGWSDEASLRYLPGAERLQRLGRNRSLQLLPKDPTELVRLATMPAWEVKRPRLSGDVRHTAEQMLAAIA